MPLYEYECERCGHVFEAIQKFSDPPVAVCPKCGGPVHKLQSAPAFQFKGSGWYITDYARQGKKGSDSSAKAAATDGNKAGETKTDSSTTTKSDTSTAKTESKAD